jgi:hydroxymethylbilane synthase
MAGDGIVLRLGTRGSPLALAQAHEARARLCAAHGWPEDRVEIVVIATTGDAIQDRALSEAGGKGLFTKELDVALLAGGIHFAVHSAKDLPTALPDGVDLSGFLPREDVRDAFIARDGGTIADLPRAAVVGSASLRRQAQIRRLRPDLDVRLLRGNVQTRLRKVDAGEYHATILAMAGLKRLGLTERVTEHLALHDFLPAVGQGAIAITARRGDAATADALAPILDRDTGLALSCERAFLAVMDGSCRTPIAGHARVEGGHVLFRGQVLAVDGSESAETVTDGPDAIADRVGRAAGRDLLDRAPAHLLASFRGPH